MAGALTLMLGDESGGAGGGGALGSLVWTNIYTPPGTRFGVTNTLTITGITGSLTLTGNASGPSLGSLEPVLNGFTPSSWNPAGTPQPVTVMAGDTLAWAINNFTGTTVSGTVTVKRTDTGATIATFTYLVHA
ncbi:MAG TPA: hypothetical protein VIJ59_07135 [Caulobacteraceae bacterium]